jgi:hypothetical protein
MQATATACSGRMQQARFSLLHFVCTRQTASQRQPLQELKC